MRDTLTAAERRAQDDIDYRDRMQAHLRMAGMRVVTTADTRWPTRKRLRCPYCDGSFSEREMEAVAPGSDVRWCLGCAREFGGAS